MRSKIIISGLMAAGICGCGGPKGMYSVPKIESCYTVCQSRPVEISREAEVKQERKPSRNHSTYTKTLYENTTASRSIERKKGNRTFSKIHKKKKKIAKTISNKIKSANIKLPKFSKSDVDFSKIKSHFRKQTTNSSNQASGK